MLGEIDHERLPGLVSMIGACPDEDALVGLAEALLDVERAREVEQHIDGCARCAEAVAGFALASQSSAAPELGARLPRGTRIGRYTILDLTGAGAMGTVYAAHDPELDRAVALKVIHPQVAETGEARARMLGEARALARLAHPNVVTVHDVGVAGDRVFVVMELVAGLTLSAWLATAPRSTDELRRVLLDVARGLAAAHGAGIVHRDVKPDNVLVGIDGRARIGDFGLAHAERGAPDPAIHRPAVGALIGTPAYMAPEQLRGEPCDARADQLGFCVMAFEAWEGRRPFSGATPAALAASIEGGAPTPSRMPPALWAAVSVGLRGRAAARHATMAPLIAALEAPAGRTRLASWKRAGIAAAGVALLATGMEWVSAPLVGRSGLQTPDGMLIAVIALVAGVVGLLRAGDRHTGRVSGLVHLIAGVLGTATAIYDLADIHRSVPPTMAGLVAPGVGLWLDVLALAAMAVIGGVLVVRGRSAGGPAGATLGG